jgi:hypothetical protein
MNRGAPPDIRQSLFMNEFRLLVSIEREATLLPCTAFLTSSDGFHLGFRVTVPIEIPRSLLCAGRHRANYAANELIKRYEAVPGVVAFEMQVVCDALAREMQRRRSMLEQAAMLRPRIAGNWRSLSPGPAPRGSSERLFDMDALSCSSDDSDDGGLPTGGRFGLWMIHAFDIDSDAQRQGKTPPFERLRSGSVGSLDVSKFDALHRRSVSPPSTPRLASAVVVGALDRVVPISWQIGGGTAGGSVEDSFERAALLVDAACGSFTLELDGMRLHCGVRREWVDHRFALCIDQVAVTVRRDSPIAPVFELVGE